MNVRSMALGFYALCAFCLIDEPVTANPPVASYIFPAGGQRGTAVPVRVGGLFLHDRCGFDLAGPGITIAPELTPIDRIWFEGPVIPQPDSQQAEDYPSDMGGKVTLSARGAPPGAHRVRLSTAQGAAGGLIFVVGDLPEVVEREVEGQPVSQRVMLPVTANGRIFPRDDIDLWSFEADAGQAFTASLLGPLLNSPLQPKLDVLDAAGRVVAEAMAHPLSGSDASVVFVAPAKGEYRVRVTDARGQGGPAYVYRLTLTGGATAMPAYPLRVPPDAFRDALWPHSEPQTVPVALNGRFESEGPGHDWRIEMKRGVRYALEVQARKFGSPLYAAIAVRDAAGKELARAESADSAADPTLAFLAPADGAYTVRVSERYRGRFGPRFAYRVRVSDAAQATPDFKLTLPSDALTLLRGGTAKLRVGVERTGAFKGPVEVRVAGLPEGVTASKATAPPNATSVEVTLTATAAAPVRAARLSVTGTAALGPEEATRVAVHRGNGFVPDEPSLLLGVGIPTPFKVTSGFVMTSAPRGEVYRRPFNLERNGFDGPVEVRLADRQARHLQGVTGPVLVVPPGQGGFVYPAALPPWMELGRTCRVCVVAVAKVKDADGREHSVSHSSTEQNQQMIVVVGPGRLDIALGKATVLAAPGRTVRLPVVLSRGKGLAGPARVSPVVPVHWRGLSAAPITVPADRSEGEIELSFGPDAGPFDGPLTVRATVADEESPVTAEAKLEIVRE